MHYHGMQHSKHVCNSSYPFHPYSFIYILYSILKGEALGSNLLTATDDNADLVTSCRVQAEVPVWIGLSQQSGSWTWASGEQYDESSTPWSDQDPTTGDNAGDCAFLKPRGQNTGYVIRNYNKECADVFPYCCDPGIYVLFLFCPLLDDDIDDID